VGLLSVDSSDKGNVDLLQEAVDLANKNRETQHSKQLNPSATAYWLLAPRAVHLAWAAVSLRQRTRLRHFDLVFDEANLHSSHRTPFITNIKESFGDEKVEVESVRWASEQEELLLHVPDYIAGVALRKFTKGDCPASWAHVARAQQRGQIMVQDPVEFYSLPPKK
jgi:hypothetical protein